jgi:heme A synthase
MNIEGDRERNVRDEPPPLVGSWGTVYVVVLCYLGLLVAGLYALTRMFRY